MRISVFGLGYVGAVSVACLARDGHQVIGVDVDKHKLRLIQSGSSPVVEDGIQSLIESAISSGRLTVSDDGAAAIVGSEVSFICVGTPSRVNGSQDTSVVLRVAEQIGTALKEINDFHVVVVRSTVPPGTVAGEVRQTLEQSSGKRCNTDFGLCFQPEFLREGSSVQDYDNPPFTVVGVESEKSSNVLEELFGHLPGDFIVTDIGSAEMLKYACNSFHALKVTFANEIGRVSQSVGVDSHEVMDLVCRDTRLNISPAYLRPGFAFGGSCLPKDLRALLHLAKSNDVDIPMLSGVLPSNRAHIDEAIQRVLQTGTRSVGLIGLSFKGGTDDLRESPLVMLAEHFIGKGLELAIYDPRVSLARLIGANKRYIEESIPHIAALMRKSCEEVLASANVVVLGISDKAILECLYSETNEDHYVLDLAGTSALTRLKGRYEGLCW